MSQVIYNNIDDIIKYVKSQKIDGVKNITKYDGITFECTKTKKSNIDEIKQNINNVCRAINVLPISIEENKTDDTKFIVQLPQLDVIYSEEQIEAIYKSSFDFLLQDTLLQRPNITKEELLKNKAIYVKNAILIYCRNNINPYRKSTKEYLTDPEYVYKIMQLFITYIKNSINIK